MSFGHLVSRCNAHGVKLSREDLRYVSSSVATGDLELCWCAIRLPSFPRNAITSERGRYNSWWNHSRGTVAPGCGRQWHFTVRRPGLRAFVHVLGLRIHRERPHVDCNLDLGTLLSCLFLRWNSSHSTFPKCHFCPLRSLFICRKVGLGSGKASHEICISRK